MIELALVPIALGLIALIAWQQQQFGLREDRWAAERARLISQIQHPEIVQHVQDYSLTPEVIEEIRPPEPDDIDLVGTVQTFDGPGD
jgi:hypothetical protein